MAVSSKEKVREIYEVLPKLDCGLCGYDNCGQFARAVAEGRASPYGCRQDPWAGYRISEIVEVKVPAYSYAAQPAFIPTVEVNPSIETLRGLKEVANGLFQEVNGILAKIENQKARRGGRYYVSVRRRGLGRRRWKRS